MPSQQKVALAIYTIRIVPRDDSPPNDLMDAALDVLNDASIAESVTQQVISILRDAGLEEFFDVEVIDGDPV